MKKNVAILLALVLTVASFAGCASKPAAPPADSGQPTESASTGGESSEAPAESSAKPASATWAFSNEIEQMDPALSNYSRSNMMLKNVFGGLFRVNEENIPEKVYCEDYTVDETGTKYEFKIVQGAKWSDGSPLTAHDFEYNMKRVADPNIASKAAADSFFLKNAERAFNGECSLDEIGVKAIDDTTLQIELSGPTPYFLYVLTMPSYFPVKKEIVEQQGDAWTKSPDTYISNGAFMAKEISPLNYTFVKNPNFVFADQVGLEELKIVIMDSREAHFAAYKTGDIDVSDYLSAEAISEYKDSSELKLSDRVNLYYFDLNNYNKEMSDVRVRKALSMAIDRKLIINNIIEKSHHPAYSIIPYGMPDLLDGSKQFRDVSGDLFTEDVEQAKQLLAEAGYPNGEGLPVLKFFTQSNQIDVDTAQAMQDMWLSNLGVKTEITTFEDKAYWSEQDQMQYDIFRDGFTSSFPDPYGMFLTFIWQKQERQTGWKSEEFEKLMADSRATTDQAKREEYFLKAEKLMIDEMPIIPLYHMVDNFLCKPHLKGIFKTGGGHIVFEKAYVE